jgi:hypothetical protein
MDPLGSSVAQVSGLPEQHRSPVLVLGEALLARIVEPPKAVECIGAPLPRRGRQQECVGCAEIAQFDLRASQFTLTLSIHSPELD